MKLGNVIDWRAISKEDIIQQEVLGFLFDAVRVKGVLYREFQKTGKISQSIADEFISHVLTLYEAVDVLAKIPDKEYKEVMRGDNTIIQRVMAASRLFVIMKQQLKRVGIFSVSGRAQLSNKEKGRGMMLGSE